MTEESYWQNVRRGVTGRSDTCFLASFDRISLRTCVSPQLYEAYAAMAHRFWETRRGLDYYPMDIVQESRELQQQLWRELGVNTLKNNNGMRANSLQELETMLAKSLSGGFRTIVYIVNTKGNLRCAGLIDAGDGYYAARSTSTPFDNEDRVSVEEIFPLLHQPARVRMRAGGKTRKDGNIFALAPERKR